MRDPFLVRSDGGKVMNADDKAHFEWLQRRIWDEEKLAKLHTIEARRLRALAEHFASNHVGYSNYASLIAAAPELWEVVKGFLKHEPDIVEKAQQLIKQLEEDENT